MKKLILGFCLSILLTGTSFAEEIDLALSDNPMGASSLDIFKKELNNYINTSNEIILDKAENADNPGEDTETLREFNVNLEICRDFQMLSERYLVYLSWLSDLYSLREQNPQKEEIGFMDDSIDRLENRIINDLQFDIENYFPAFLPDITDGEVNKFGTDLLQTLKRLKNDIDKRKKG